MRIELNFHNIALATATTISYNVISAIERTLCCWGHQRRNSWSLSWLVFFSGGVIYSLEKLQGGFPGLISYHWHLAKHSIISHYAVHGGNYVILWRQCEEGSKSSSRVCFWDKGISPLCLETLSEEGIFISDLPWPHSYFLSVVVTTLLSHFCILRYF